MGYQDNTHLWTIPFNLHTLLYFIHKISKLSNVQEFVATNLLLTQRSLILYVLLVDSKWKEWLHGTTKLFTNNVCVQMLHNAWAVENQVQVRHCRSRKLSFAEKFRATYFWSLTLISSTFCYQAMDSARKPLFVVLKSLRPF